MKELLQILKELFEQGLERFGLHYSSYRGFVYDNQDPDNMNRLRLIIPFISKTVPYKYWAFPEDNYSGFGYGSQNIPEKGTLVWVSFEQGDVKSPIWKHGHFGKNEKPEGTNKRLLNIKNKWFKTPGGHTIELDDETDTIYITHSKGTGVVISEDSISLLRNDKKISLGSLDKSEQAAVLGDSLEELLNKTLNLNSEILNALTNYSAVQALAATAGGVTSGLSTGYTNLGKDLATQTLSLENLKKEVNKIKSKNITLD